MIETVLRVEGKIGYPVGLFVHEHMNNVMTVISEFFNNMKDFDTIRHDTDIDIICRGSSSLILGTIFYTELSKRYPERQGIRIVNINKTGEYSHTDNRYMLSQRKHVSIFVDDCMASGETLFNTIEAIRERIGGYTFDYVLIFSKVSYGLLKRCREKNVAKYFVHSL